MVQNYEKHCIITFFLSNVRSLFNNKIKGNETNEKEKVNIEMSS